MGDGGLGKLAVQSLAGAVQDSRQGLARGLTNNDLMVARLLKALSTSDDPHHQAMTWAQGVPVVAKIQAFLQRRRSS